MLQPDSAGWRRNYLGSIVGRRGRSLARQREITGILFATPAAIYFMIFWVYPLLRAVYISFTDWELFSQPHWVGLSNYARLIVDPSVRRSLVVTLYYGRGTTLSIFVISLGLALLVNSRVRGKPFFRTVYYLPAVMPWVAVSVVWMQIYMPNVGLYRVFLGPLMKVFGVREIRWLDGRQLAMPAIIIASVWKSVGANVVLFLAGLQGVPEEFHEAAKVDGASTLQTILRITLPLLRPTMLFVLVMLVIGAFKVFTPVYMMTRGGPGGDTRVLSMYLYETAFAGYHMGQASAVSVVMLLILLALTVTQIRIFRGGGTYE